MTAVRLDNTTATRWFGNSTSAGRAYDEADWEATFAALVSNGPIPGVGNQLSVFGDASGMQVKVRSGQTFIQGHDGDAGSTITLPVTAYTGTTRLDAVVLRRITGQGIELECRPGSNSTTPPVLTQNSSVWEEYLWYVLVDNNVSIPANKVDGTSGGGDLRKYAAAAGGLVSCVSAHRPANPYESLGIYERDTRRQRTYDSTGTWLYTPGTGLDLGADLFHSSPPAIASAAWTACNLDSENWDGASFHSSSNPYVVIPSNGIYQVSCEIGWPANATGGRHVGVHKASGAAFTSGTPSHPIQSTMAITDSSVPTRVRGMKRFSCVAGDWITLVGRQDSGGSLTPASTALSLYLVGYAS